MDTRESRIRARAHQIWESEGRPEAQETRHWQMAEEAIDSEDKAASERPAGEGMTEKSGATSAGAATPVVGASTDPNPAPPGRASKRAPRPRGRIGAKPVSNGDAHRPLD